MRVVMPRKRLIVTQGRQATRVHTGYAFNSPIRTEKLQLAAATTAFPNQVIEVANSKTMAVARSPFRFGGDFLNVVLAFDGNRLGTFGVQTNATQEITILECALEQDSPSQTVRVMFGGSRSRVIGIGASDIQSDPILPSQFGLHRFAADSKFWVRLKISVPDNGEILQNQLVNSITGAKFAYYNPSNDVDQIYSTGTLSTPTGGSTDNYAYMPSAILGEPVNGCQSVIAIGDSLTFSNAESANNWPITGVAWFSRAMLNSGGLGAIASMKIARGGTTAANLALHTNMQKYFRYANVVAIHLGTNDIGTAGTGNLNNLLVNYQTICRAACNAGVRKIMAMKLWPRASSTDSFATVENQTCLTGWGPGEQSDQFNAMLDSVVGSDIHEAFDATVLRASSNRNKWAVGMTTDETHPDDVGHAAAAAQVRPNIIALGYG